jgi:hypothetical protein
LDEIRKPETRRRITAATFVLAAILVFRLVGITPALAADRYVSASIGADTSDCLDRAQPCRLIGKAFTESSSGDVIWIEAGTYSENLLFAFKDVTLIGSGPSVTAIDAQRSGRPLTIAGRAHVTVHGITIRDGFHSGFAGAAGGGVYVEPDSGLTLKNCIVTGNTVESTAGLLNEQGAKGGGIYSGGNLTLEHTLVSGNRAIGMLAQGGGIAFESLNGRLRIVRSTIAANVAEPRAPGTPQGAGLWVSADSTKATVWRSTIHGNVAGAPVLPGSGGGIYVVPSTDLDVRNSTIVANQAYGSGGGIFNRGRLTLAMSVLALNQSGGGTSPNCFGEQLISGGNNFVDLMTGCNIQPAGGDTLAPADAPLDLGLGPLQNNGGVTPTVMPSAASPLVDVAGLTNCNGPDQRNVSTPLGDGCDIGAVEADMVLLRPQFAQAELDVARVTQGLDVDVTGISYYALIAGKHALVRAQLYADSRERLIESAACRVQRLTRFDPMPFNPRRRVPDAGPVVTLTGSYDQFNKPINRQAYGFFNGSNVVDCWLSAQDVAVAGDYGVQAEIKMAGVPQSRVFDLGVKTFYPSENIRLLLFPYVMPPGHREFTPWDYTQRAAIREALREMNRRYPIRSGTGPIDTTGATGKGAPGLRVDLGPVTSCGPAAGNTPQDFEKAQSDCDAAVRVAAKVELQRRNSLMDSLDPTMAADRIDVSGVLALVPDTGGGQAQDPGTGPRDCSAGSAVESANRGESASVVGQEVGHCLGLVPRASYHWDPGSESHSRTWSIPLWRGGQLIDTTRQQDVPGVVSLMNGSTAGESNTFLEGYEWNWLNPLTRKFAGDDQPSVPPLPAQRSAPKRGLLEVSGSIGSDGQVRHLYTRQAEHFAYVATANTRESRLRVLFFGERGAFLREVPIAVSFKATHREIRTVPFFLASEIPDGARSILLTYGNETLLRTDVSMARPVIRNIKVDDLDGQALRVSWELDPQTPAAFYRVFFKPGRDAAPILVATGLTQTTLTVRQSGLPFATDGAFVVEASVGFAASEATSRPVRLAPRTPLVGISAPVVNGRYIETSPVMLSGFGEAAEGAPLAPRALTWHSSRSGDLGRGETLRVSLPAGRHRITLRAIDPSQTTAEQTVDIDVKADVDNDGIPDEDELKHACIAIGHDDSNSDPDGDGISSRLEVMLQLNPCVADTDGDGIPDGEEMRAGSDPAVRSSVPLPQRIFVADRLANLGTCGVNVREQRRPVIADATLIWEVRTDSDWLLAERDRNADRQLIINADCDGLAPGRYEGHVLLGAPGSASTELILRLSVGR